MVVGRGPLARSAGAYRVPGRHIHVMMSCGARCGGATDRHVWGRPTHRRAVTRTHHALTPTRQTHPHTGGHDSSSHHPSSPRSAPRSQCHAVRSLLSSFSPPSLLRRGGGGEKKMMRESQPSRSFRAGAAEAAAVGMMSGAALRAPRAPPVWSCGALVSLSLSLSLSRTRARARASRGS